MFSVSAFLKKACKFLKRAVQLSSVLAMDSCLKCSRSVKHLEFIGSTLSGIQDLAVQASNAVDDWDVQKIQSSDSYPNAHESTGKQPPTFLLWVLAEQHQSRQRSRDLLPVNQVHPT